VIDMAPLHDMNASEGLQLLPSTTYTAPIKRKEEEGSKTVGEGTDDCGQKNESSAADEVELVLLPSATYTPAASKSKRKSGICVPSADQNEQPLESPISASTGELQLLPSTTCTPPSLALTRVASNNQQHTPKLLPSITCTPPTSPPTIAPTTAPTPTFVELHKNPTLASLRPVARDIGALLGPPPKPRKIGKSSPLFCQSGNFLEMMRWIDPSPPTSDVSKSSSEGEGGTVVVQNPTPSDPVPSNPVPAFHPPEFKPPAREIYFTAVPTSGEEVGFSEPLAAPLSPPTTPPGAVTPTQETFDEAVAAKKRSSRPASQSAKTALRLTPGHVERLAKAFVEAPVVKGRLCRTRKDGKERPEQTRAAEKPMKVKLRGIAVTDSKQPGAPIRFTTEGYRESPNVLNVRGQSFLNAPYGDDCQYDCCLHVERSGDGPEEKCKVLICLVNEILDRWTGTAIYNLVAEVDITKAVTDAVLAEITADSSMSDIKVELTTAAAPAASISRNDSTTTSSIDWCAVADELQSEYEIDTMVDTASLLFSMLDSETCTPQTLTLLTDLERLKRKHEDFVIVSTKPHPTNPMAGPVRAGVPWISERFEAKLHEEKRFSEVERRGFRVEVIEAVTKRASARKPFTTAVA